MTLARTATPRRTRESWNQTDWRHRVRTFAHEVPLKGTGNLALGNSILDSTFIPDPLIGASVDGLLVNAQARRTLLLHNRATGDVNDGIHVQSRSTLIVGNVADDNGNYGIEAVPGVVAAGNRASGNGNPAQCLNVVCR